MLFRSLFVFGLVFALASGVTAADTAKKRAKGALKGTVKEVQVDKDSATSGTLTVQLKVGKKKQAANAPAPETRKITVAADTKFEKIEARPKGQKPAKGQLPTGQAAKFSDLQTNANVIVVLHKGTDRAEKVLLLPARKKAK